MKATPAEVEKYLVIISETPQRIARVTAGLDETRLQLKAASKSWSANDILAHLRACADLWTHSIYAMLAENEPAFSDIDERKWARPQDMRNCRLENRFTPIPYNVRISYVS